MSIAIIPTSIGGAQAAVSSAAVVKNILAGLSPSITGLDAIAALNKDIGGFQFDYIGEQTLVGATDITDHYSEDNTFMQDHKAIKPTMISMRGFVSEVVFNKSALLPVLAALTSALAPVTPYIGLYSRGAAQKMTQAISQTEQIINQIQQIMNIGGSISKLFGLSPTSKVQQAYDTLEALRRQGTAFTVVTPWAVFGDPTAVPYRGQMMIERVTMIDPEETRTWNDILVSMKEIRVAPSLISTTLDNARASQVPTYNGLLTRPLSAQGAVTR